VSVAWTYSPWPNNHPFPGSSVWTYRGPDRILIGSSAINSLPAHTLSPSLRILLAVLLAIGSIVVDYRYRQLDRLRSALSVVAYPVYYTADLFTTLARKLQGYLITEEELRRSNRSLYRNNLVLRARLQQLEALEAENLRLRDLLGSSLRLGNRVLIAEVMGVTLDPYRQQIVIDRGTASGVFVGQSVLTADAVMGQIIYVSPRSATVLLITDASHGLPVQVERNGLRAVAQGMGDIQRLELSHLPRNADVRTGDLLMTSGLGSRFPAGYPVARVAAVHQESGQPFVTAIAEPLAHLHRNREVLLVWTLLPSPLVGKLTVGTDRDSREAP